MSVAERDDYGWYEETEPAAPSMESTCQPLHKALSNPPSLSAPPSYILESSLETQQLWYSTAGQRPQQSREEREKIERLWAKNFEASEVQYPAFDESGSQDRIPRSEFGGEVVLRANSHFTNSVSKFFPDRDLTITIQVPQLRVVETQWLYQHAEFLLLVSFGSHTTVTFGIWKRHTEFERLMNSLSPAVFKNTLLSWQLMLKHNRWYRRLDADYLTLKCFLLERFIHDLLFESASPDVLVRFLDLLRD